VFNAPIIPSLFQIISKHEGQYSVKDDSQIQAVNEPMPLADELSVPICEEAKVLASPGM
jgi:hypothetical protein